MKLYRRRLAGIEFQRVRIFRTGEDKTWKNAQISAFGSTCQANKKPADDANIQALLAAETPTCTIFGKTSVLHVEEVLRTTLENNLRIIENSVHYLVSQGREVIYDAEHFFDGYRENPEYAIKTLKQCLERRSQHGSFYAIPTVVSMPWQVGEIVRIVETGT